LFLNEQILLSISEDDLQRALFILHSTTEQFGIEISPQKSKITAFNGWVPNKSKIVIDNTIL
jgi:hypothetical protein